MEFAGTHLRLLSSWWFALSVDGDREIRSVCSHLTLPERTARPVGRVLSACFPRPGSTPPKCRLTCGFTSHGFSPVSVSFHAVAEQGRNWHISAALSSCNGSAVEQRVQQAMNQPLTGGVISERVCR